MKKNLKNIVLGLGLSVLGLFAQAQNGLENILVERYYVANAADAAGSSGTLPVGSVTYRVYADLAAGYTFQAAYGNSAHTLNVRTTTTFFNNEDRGATVPNGITRAQLDDNTVMLDSWVSVGSAGVNLAGVLKSEDAIAGGALIVNSNGILANNVLQMGIPLTVHDGLYTGSIAARTSMPTSLLGIDLSAVDATSQAGSLITANGGTWSAQGGAVGPTASNRVLIGQFTTDGTFSFDLNIQIGTPSNGTQKYVVSNAVAGEQVAAFCSQSFVANPAAVTVSLTAPASASVGVPVNVSASPASTDGISFVEFYVDGVSVGVDFSAPYEATFNSGAVEGTLAVKAVAHSNQAVEAIALASVVVGNAAPVVTINAIAGPLEVGKAATIEAVATDDASVASVVFVINGGAPISGTLTATPDTYSITYTPTAVGSISIVATATDGAATPKSTTSATVSVNVVANAGPTVVLAQPTTPSAYGTAITLSATATDVDGVASVEFFDGTTSLGMGTTVGGGVYTRTTSATLGLGSHSFTALAKDGATPFAQTTSAARVVVITNPLPVVTLVSGSPNPVLQGSVVTLSATATDDGTVTGVQFFNGTTLIPGTVTQSGNVFTLAYTPTFFGSISLTAKATDNLGQVTTSAPVSITVNPAGAYELVSTSQVCNIESVCMPIKSLQAVDKINGYNFTIKYDKAKVIPTGNITVSNDMISAAILNGRNAEYVTDYSTSITDTAASAFSYLNIGIYFNTNVPVGQEAMFKSTVPGKLVACVEFTKKPAPAFASVDQTTLAFSEVIESYTDADAANKPANVSGIFSTYKDYTLSGSLKYWSDMSPIAFDASNPTAYLITNIKGNRVSPPAGAAVQPDLSGNFTYNVQNGMKLNVIRDIPNSVPVAKIGALINGQDAYLTALTSTDGTSKINWTPSAYQMIAMDVNRDKLITAGDATQINQRSVKRILEFNQPLKTNRDWLFVANSEVASNLNYLVSTNWPAKDATGYSRYRVPSVDTLQYATQNDTLCPLINDEKYIGIMLGDIDASYASVAHDGVVKSAEVASGSEIIFDLLQAVVENGNLVIPVSLNSSDAVNNFNFAFKLDEQKIAVQSVDGFGQGMNLSWNYVIEEKTLAVSAYNAQYNIPAENSSALTLTVMGTDALTAADFDVTLALVNGKTARLKVIDASMLGVRPNNKASKVNVYPNPTSDKLNIEVSSDSKVQILDLNGKRIGAERNVNANQKQVIDVTKMAKGVYMVKVYNNQSVEVKKIVIK